MREPRLTGVARQALGVFGVVLAVAPLSVGEASADGPVQLRSRLGDICLDGPSPNWPAQVVVKPMQWGGLAALESHR